MTNTEIMMHLEKRSMPEPNTGCWLWLQSTGSHGYGQTFMNGKVTVAHRVSYEAYKGKIPIDLVIDHKCRNRICINPEHLEPVTDAENLRRGDHTAHRVYLDALRASITHCPKGHDMSLHGRIKPSTNRRYCSKCNSAQGLRRYHERKKER